MFLACAAVLWMPIIIYLTVAPTRYTSEMSLILPGSSSSASVNLRDIGQATSYSTSLFAGNSVSPTETYKRLLTANRILAQAAQDIGMLPKDFGMPTIELVDQTTLIHVEMSGTTAEDAQIRNKALLDAFFKEVGKLRTDELTVREASGQSAIQEYQLSVQNTREEITKLQNASGLASPSQYYTLVEATDKLRGQIDTLEADLQRETGTVHELEQQLGVKATEASRALRLSTDSAYMALMKEAADHAAKLADATARYGKNHPETTKARASHTAALNASNERAHKVSGGDLKDMPHILEQAVTGGRTTLLADLVRRETERRGLETQLSKMRSLLQEELDRLAKLAPLATQLEDTQRDFSVAEAVFATAIARSQSGKNDIYASYPLVQVLEDPTLPTLPSSPQPKLAIAAGIAATFMLIMALALGSIRKSLIRRLLAKPAPET